MTRLTLNLDPAVVTLAKRLAKEQGTSVSAMFQRFVTLAAAPRRPARIGPITRKAGGVIRLPPGRDARALLEDALLERHDLTGRSRPQ
jgi:hypothetical protein